jgi:GT2 family glycosyltransferase
MIDLSISIVSYNTRELLQRCLTSIQLAAKHDDVRVQVVVADNGSTDGSLEMVAQEFPSVERLELKENLGYGRANNKAFEKATGRYFFILNSDTEVPPGSLRNLLEFLDDNPKVGALGAKLVLPDGSTQISWAREQGLLWVICEQFYLDRLPFIKQLIFGSTHAGSHDRIRRVDQVCGAALLVRSEVFKEVKGFDPAFFMYYEDTDLCIRIRRAGHDIFFLPSAPILHHLGGSSQDAQQRAQMIASYNQSRYYYFYRYKSKYIAHLLKIIVLSGALARFCFWSSVSFVRPGARSQARAKVALFRDVLRRTARMTPHINSQDYGAS